MGWFDGERGWAAGRRARHKPCWFRPRRNVGRHQLSGTRSSSSSASSRRSNKSASASITSATTTTSHALSLGPSSLATPRRSCRKSPLLFCFVVVSQFKKTNNVSGQCDSTEANFVDFILFFSCLDLFEFAIDDQRKWDFVSNLNNIKTVFFFRCLCYYKILVSLAYRGRRASVFPSGLIPVGQSRHLAVFISFLRNQR